MTQESAITFSIDDYQIVANNQFGAPLTIYRKRQSCTRRSQWICLILFLISLAMLIVHFMVSVKVWHATLIGSHGSVFEYFSFLVHQYLFTSSTLNVLVVFLLVQITVWYSWVVQIPQSRYSRLIACEEGLLYIRYCQLNERKEELL